MDGGLPPTAACSTTQAEPQQILDLAAAYSNAAEELFGRKCKGLAQLPARLCALHAIELYLHAFLRFRGATPAQIKQRHHAVWHAEFAERLLLDSKTCDHLQRLSEAPIEYRDVRYAPDRLGDLSHPNRILLTLHNIRDQAHLGLHSQRRALA